jgi:hypothetical protein
MTTTLEQFLVTMMMTPIVNPLDPKSLYSPMTSWGVSTVLEGLSGLGKSKRVSDIGQLVGLATYCFSGATKSPDDFSGVYVPTTNGLLVECVLPAARSIINKGKGVIFADEVSNMRPAVQAGFLTMVDEKRVGDTPLPNKTRILMAMNPPEHAANGHAVSPPMANKMAHYKYACPTIDESIRWRMGIPAENPLKDIKDAEALVLREFYKHWGAVNALTIGFFKCKPDLLHVQPKPDDPASSEAWPSPRTWHWASCAVTTARCLGMPPALEGELVESLVGEAGATAWVEWVSKADLPNPEDMLTKGWKYDRRRIDISFAAIVAMTQYVIDKDYKDAVKAATPAWNILHSIIEDGNADITVDMTKLLIRAKLGRKHHGDATLMATVDKVLNALSTHGHDKADLLDV